MSGENIRKKMQQLASADGKNLDSLSLVEQWGYEDRVRREFPELNDGPQPSTTKKEATRKSTDAIVSGNMWPLFGAARQLSSNDWPLMKQIAKERGYDLSKRADFEECEKIALSIIVENEQSARITFAVSDKPIKMPILPSKPGKTVDGRSISAELVSALLNYDARIRPAVLKLDPTEGHGKHQGTQNMPALGRVDRVYDGGDGYLWADVSTGDWI